MFEKETYTSVPIHELLAKRWSGRAYDPDRPVHDEDLRALAEAARWAPSCFGYQPWRFIICNRHRDEAAWRKAYQAMREGNQAWAGSAPVLILTCCDTIFAERDIANDWCEYDSGAAALSICLQAAALDLMTHQMAGFDKDRARDLFAIPSRFRPLAMMAVGYQLPKERVPEWLQEKEFAPRVRDPLQEHFFLGEWGRGME